MGAVPGKRERFDVARISGKFEVTGKESNQKRESAGEEREELLITKPN